MPNVTDDGKFEEGEKDIFVLAKILPRMMRIYVTSSSAQALLPMARK
jgi:hypothetical protein